MVLVWCEATTDGGEGDGGGGEEDLIVFFSIHESGNRPLTRLNSAVAPHDQRIWPGPVRPWRINWDLETSPPHPLGYCVAVVDLVTSGVGWGSPVWKTLTYLGAPRRGGPSPPRKAEAAAAAM